MDFSKLDFQKLCVEENNQKKFRRQTFALPGGTIKEVYLDLALSILNLICGAILALLRLAV